MNHQLIKTSRRHIHHAARHVASAIEQTARPCLCGQPKKSGHMVCLDCYQAAPQSAKNLFRSLGTRREGARALKAFALTRRTESKADLKGLRGRLGEFTNAQGEVFQCRVTAVWCGAINHGQLVVDYVTKEGGTVRGARIHHNDFRPDPLTQPTP